MTSRASTCMINIRLRAQTADRALIDRAAEATGKSRSEFVLDAAKREAKEVLFDQRMSHLDAKAWKAFTHALDEPPRRNDRLADLLRRAAPWER